MNDAENRSRVIRQLEQAGEESVRRGFDRGAYTSEPLYSIVTDWLANKASSADRANKVEQVDLAKRAAAAAERAAVAAEDAASAARKANELASEANRLARLANTHADKANIVAKLAAAIAAAAAIITILGLAFGGSP